MIKRFSLSLFLALFGCSHTESNQPRWIKNGEVWFDGCNEWAMASNGEWVPYTANYCADVKFEAVPGDRKGK